MNTGVHRCSALMINDLLYSTGNPEKIDHLFSETNDYRDYNLMKIINKGLQVVKQPLFLVVNNE